MNQFERGLGVKVTVRTVRAEHRPHAATGNRRVDLPGADTAHPRAGVDAFTSALAPTSHAVAGSRVSEACATTSKDSTSARTRSSPPQVVSM